MIVIWAKPGTHPATYLRVKYKRKLPKIGDTFKALPCSPFGKLSSDITRWTKRDSWYCDGINGDLYLLERM